MYIKFIFWLCYDNYHMNVNLKRVRLGRFLFIISYITYKK